MSDCYVFDAFDDNFDTAGLVGALMPVSCEYYAEAGTIGEITLEHPYDEYGKWRALVAGNYMKVSVPMPTLPVIDENKIVTSIETYKVKSASLATSAQRYLYSNATSEKKKKLLPGGTKVVVMARPSEGRWKVKTSKYGTGWMDPEGIDEEITETIPDTVNGIEQVAPSIFIRPQLFEIRTVQQKDEGIVVKGMQVAGQLLKNITSYTATGTVSLQTSLDGILKNCKSAHDFTAHTDIADTRTGVSWQLINPIKAMLDPEEGAAARWESQFIADDYDLYFLHRAGVDRGIRIEYGKNLVGIDCTVDMSNLATRIIPVGETKDGKDLFLNGTQWVDSPYVSNYSYPHIYVLKCQGCKVGTDGVTTTIAMARMREQAQQLIASGCDIPEISLTIEYSSLGDTEEYKQYRQLERLYLYDLVHIRYQKIGINADLEVVSMTWDCIRDKPVQIEFGTLHTTAAKISTWQIPSGLNGNKITGGTIGSGALMSDVISIRHMQAESVNTTALQAKSVTTEKIAAGAITTETIDAGAVTAEKIEAGAIKAQSIEAITAKIEEIVSGKITSDELFTAILGAVKLSAETGNFNLAEVENLLSNALVLEEGLAGSMMITNLAVTSANLLNATIGKLVIKGEDGKYYAVMVGSDGVIHTQPVEVTEDEIAAGETGSGMQIVEETINAQSINGQTIKAQEALFNTVLTAALNAGKITANDAMLASATIPLLYATAIKALGNTLDISANESIQLIVGEVETAKDSADSANTAAKSAQSTADSAQQTAEFAKVYDSAEPPSDTPEAGKLWLDRGVTPPVMRRWMGADAPTGRDFETATEGNPLIVSNRGQVSEIAVQARCIAQQAGSGEPWPGGSGKNLFNVGDLLLSHANAGFEVSGSTVHVYTTGDGGTWRGPRTNAFTVRQGVTYTLSGRLTDYVSGNARFGLLGQADNVFLAGASVRFNAETGYKAITFTPAVDQEVYLRLLCTDGSLTQGDVTFADIQLEMGSAATDYEPWENIRPISGRESVTVRGCGKNLFQRVKDYSSSGVTVTVAEDGKVTATGTAPDYTWVRDAYGVYNNTAPLFTAAEDTPVTLSGGTAGVNVAVQYITASGVRSTQYTQGQSKKTFTLPAGASLVRQYIRIPANTVVNGEIVSPQMELGSTATEYAPYRDLGGGEIAPASPLYGLAGVADTVEIMADGSVQAVHRTGVVVIDGDQYVPYDSAYAVPEGVYAYTCPLFNTDAPPIEDFKGLCSHFRIIPHNAAKSERVAGTAALGTSSPQWGQIWFFTAQATAAEFNAWLAAQVEAGTPVTLAYERASPQVERLEAVEPIAPQKGDNVLFTDADSLSATLYGSGWETVNDVDSQTQDVRSVANAALPKVDFQRVVRIDESGLHVGDNQINSGEVLIDSESVNVVMNGRKYSRFASNYVQFGNYQLRQSADGGLVFKLKE